MMILHTEPLAWLSFLSSVTSRLSRASVNAKFKDVSTTIDTSGPHHRSVRNWKIGRKFPCLDSGSSRLAEVFREVAKWSSATHEDTSHPGSRRSGKSRATPRGILSTSHWSRGLQFEV